MNSLDYHERHRFLSICALAILAALFLANPFFHFLGGSQEGTPGVIAFRGFITPVLMASVVGTVSALIRVLRGRADRTALVAATLVVMGWTAGVRILELRQLDALARHGVAGVPSNALDLLMAGSRIVWASIVPIGILFPIGMTLFGLTLLITGVLPRWIGVTLMAGAIFFPIGRIGGFLWALNATDVLLGAGFASLAWHLQSARAWYASANGAAIESASGIALGA